MLPITFYQRLDSNYRKLIYNLDKDLKNANLESYHDALKSFAELYMLPWQYWEHALEHKNYYGDKHYLTLFSLYQFFYPREDDELLWDSQEYFKELKLMFHRRSKNMNRKYFKTLSINLERNVNLLIYDLQVPHCDLKEIWKLYEKNICSTPPRGIADTYHEMSDLYNKIMSVEKDEGKWIEAMTESNNNEFIQQNIEFRLGGDLNNKKLWKLYIEYLRQNNIQKMLQTYSKYCRLFLTDSEMLEEYQAAVEKHATITQADINWWNYFKSFFVKAQPLVIVPWKNTFHFEIRDESGLKFLDYRLPDFNEKITPPPSLNLFFTLENSVPQNFEFHENFINYIQKNANGSFQQKLKMSCKYFHINFPVIIIYKLILTKFMEEKYITCFEQSINVSNYEGDEIKADRIFLTTMLEFSSPSSDINALSKFLPKIIKCSVKYLSITGQDLSLDEFQFLVGHGEVLDLCLLEVKIYKAENVTIAFEDLLKMLPLVEDLIVSDFCTSKETCIELTKIRFGNKFKTLSLKLDEKFDISAAEFFKFLKINACSTCQIYINLKMHRSRRNSFQREIEENINSFWTGKEKPFVKALPYEDNCKTYDL